MKKNNSEEKQEKIIINVAIYIRVSTGDQADGYGPDLQLDKAKKLLDMKSHSNEEWVVKHEHIFNDLGISGATKIEDRPGISKLFDKLKFAKDHNLPLPFQYVVVYKIDRFARKLAILLDVVDKLKEYEIGFISTTEAIDTSTPFGHAMLSILGVFAELEREMIKQRTGGGRVQKVTKGGGISDKYGYKKAGDHGYYVPYEDEAQIVKQIYFWFIYNNFTVTQIVQKLKQDKVLVPSVSLGLKTGKNRKQQPANPYHWQDKTIRTILTDEIYIGNYAYNKTTTKITPGTKKKEIIQKDRSERTHSEHKHEALIDDQVFLKVQKLLQNNKGVFVQPQKDSVYLLSKLLICDNCSHHRTGDNSGGGNYYRCGGKNSGKFVHKCTVKPLPQKELEQFVIRQIHLFLKDPQTLLVHLNQDKGRKGHKDVLFRENANS